MLKLLLSWLLNIPHTNHLPPLSPWACNGRRAVMAYLIFPTMMRCEMAIISMGFPALVWANSANWGKTSEFLSGLQLSSTARRASYSVRYMLRHRAGGIVGWLAGLWSCTVGEVGARVRSTGGLRGKRVWLDRRTGGPPLMRPSHSGCMDRAKVRSCDIFVFSDTTHLFHER